MKAWPQMGSDAKRCGARQFMSPHGWSAPGVGASALSDLGLIGARPMRVVLPKRREDGSAVLRSLETYSSRKAFGMPGSLLPLVPIALDPWERVRFHKCAGGDS